MLTLNSQSGDNSASPASWRRSSARASSLCWSPLCHSAYCLSTASRYGTGPVVAAASRPLWDIGAKHPSPRKEGSRWTSCEGNCTTKGKALRGPSSVPTLLCLSFLHKMMNRTPAVPGHRGQRADAIKPLIGGYL